MKHLETVLSKFKGKKIVVIGDVMLDKYLEGEVTRICTESPTPIVKLEKEFYELGGAGNVAMNVSSLGGDVSLFSFAGKDYESEILKSLLAKNNIKYFLGECSITTQKHRVIGKSQQILRLDKETTEDKMFDLIFKQKMIEEIKSANIVIVSDYAKGTITKDLMNSLEQFKSKIIVDPRPKNKELYKGVFLITPSGAEANEMTQQSDYFKAGSALQKELGSNILATLGERGMALFTEKTLEIPTYAREVSNVTGAGDSAIATLALSIATGASLEESAIIANYAAGIVVEKRGTYSPSLNELTEKIISRESKIIDIEDLTKKVIDTKRKGKKVIWTNGCFDLLHVGHVRYLRNAKKLGDVLVVGINSDESVRKLKGESRPVQSESERAEILSSLEFVDNVIIFSEPTVVKYLEILQPDIFAKGGDYDIESLNQEERKAVSEYNGEINFISLVEGKSSTNLIEKANNSN